MDNETMHMRLEGGRLRRSREDRSTEYLELPDGLRLIFRERKYEGWYLPGEVEREETKRRGKPFGPNKATLALRAKILDAMQRNEGNVAAVAREMSYDRQGIAYHLKRIEQETGLNPKNPDDLAQLLLRSERDG